MSKILLAAFVTMFLGSCQDGRSRLRFSAPTIIEPATPRIPSTRTLPFDKLQSEIIAPKCLMCHSDMGTPEGLAAYAVPGDPDASLLFIEVKNGNMPDGGPVLTTAELEVVREYILSLDSGSDTETVSFQMIKEEILTPSCVACHAGVSSEEGLKRWIDRRDPLESKFLKVVESGFMPLGAAPLDARKQDLIKKYLSAFAP